MKKTQLCLDKILRSFTYSSFITLARNRVEVDLKATMAGKPHLICRGGLSPVVPTMHLNFPLFSLLYSPWSINVSLPQLQTFHFKRVTEL
jgi:hypothetical protein